METCLSIPGYEGLYIINTNGNVISINSKKEKKCTYDNYGYARVQLHKNGIRKYFKIHRLVALLFIPNPYNLYTINHKDGIKTNNNISNLEWCSNENNKKHAKEMGLMRKGSNHPKVKLTEEEVLIIRSSHDTCSNLANRFNVSSSAIYHVKIRNSWKHI